MLDYFDKHQLPFPIGICDNSKEKLGTYIKGIPVVSFEEIYEKYPNLKILITSTKHGNEIAHQISKKIDFHCFVNIENYFKINELEKIIYETRFHENNSKLPSTSDAPLEFQEILEQLSAYQMQYNNGDNPDIYSDNIFFKKEIDNVDFFEISSFTTKEHSHCQDKIKLQTLINLESLNKVAKIKGENGYLVGLSLELSKPKIHNDVVENIFQFNQYLKEKNIPFMHYQLPNKLSSLKTTLPKKFTNGENMAATNIIKQLKDKHIEALDFRDFMISESIDSLTTFYRTDAHWKQSLSLLAAEYLLKKLKVVLGISFNYDFLDEDSYEKIIYPNMFLGGYGKSTGLLYGGIDDFELFLPRYKTDYTWSLPKKQYQKRGDFEDTFIFYPRLIWKLPNVTTSYFAYGGMQLLDYTIIKNNCAKNSLKILFISDSFAMPMSTFLAPHFSELHFIDLRPNIYKLSKRDLFDIIQKNRFDMVLSSFWPHTLTSHKEATDINPYTK